MNWDLLLPAFTVAPGVLYGRVLNLGLGIGFMARKILEHGAVEALVTVEIDPAVIAKFVNDDPRHTIVEGDGAAYVKEHGEAFDFIVSEIPGMKTGWWKLGGWMVDLPNEGRRT